MSQDSQLEPDSHAQTLGSDQVFRVLFEASPDAIFIHDLDGNVLECNPAACRLHGRPCPSVIGKNILDLVPAEKRTETARDFLRLVKAECNRIEGLIAATDDRTVPVEIRSSLIDYQGKPALLLHVRDITDRKRAEDALRWSQEHLRAMIETEPECVKLLAPDGTLLEMNRAGLTMIEASELAEVAGHCVYPLVTEEYREAFRALTEDVCRGNRGTLEFEMVGLKGTRRWLETHAVPLRTQPDGTNCVLAVTRDITEHRRVVNALRESEERHRSVVAALQEGIVVLQADGLISACNDSACSILGMSQDQLIGRSAMPSPVRAIHEDGSDFPPEELPGMLALRTGAPQGDVTMGLRRADGSLVWISIYAQPIFRSGDRHHPRAVVTAFVDITEKKRAEQELRSSEERLKLALESAGMGTWEWEIQSNEITCSEHLGSVFELPPGVSHFTFDFFLNAVHPEDRQRVADVIKTASEEVDYSVEFRVLRHDGVLHWIASRGRMFRDSAGKPVRVVGVAMDITERVHMEERLRQSQKVEAVGRLAGGIAYDFNNLLTSILGYSNLMVQTLPADDPFWNHADSIKKAAERAAALTRQLLAFSRRQKLQPKLFDLNETVLYMEEMVRGLIGETITLVARPATRPAYVKADPDQIEQAIVNMALNARDAMPRGGTLAIEVSHVMLRKPDPGRHADLAPGEYVILTIQDTGCGMSKSVREHLFEPFFTTKPPGEGSGLGLATSYGIIRQSGGHIHVASEVDRGTTVEIYLPLA